MAAPRPNGSIDIWNFVDNVTGVTVRKWLRDSWARRKIVALQQAVANIVVPTKTSQLQNDSGFITQADVPPGSTASSTTPLMDGTAAVGTENAFARGDHRHPTDTSRQAALNTAQLAAVNSGVTAAKVQEWDGITVPTKTSDLTNDSDYQTGTQVGNAISAEAGLMVPYGYCTIAAGTVAKTVTVSPAVTALTAGLCIAVKFQYANTATNPTLNVNGLGAKAIKRYGTTAAGTSAAANWNANSVVILVYDGTYWMLADWNNTTYSGMTDAEYQAGTSTTNRLITPARLKAAVELHAPVQSVNGATGDVTVTVPTKTSDLTNDSGFITSVPVQSVNGQTGAVDLDAADVGALPDSTVIPSNTSQLTNDSGFITSAPVTSVNGKTGAVALDASDVGANSNKSGANGGTLIPNGSDLDAYTTPGTYYVPNSSAAATIVHTPSRNSGFKLFVEGSYYSNYIAQYVLTSARLYFRTLNGSSGWLPWKQWGNGGVVSVKGNQTGQTGKWTGTIVLPELYDGLTIAYYLPYAVPSSTNVSLQLTLSDGTVTDEIPVYITGNTRATTQYEAGSTVLLTYWGAGSISIAGTAITEARWTRADYSADYSVATDSANGLMSAADKAKIDNDFAVNDPSVLCTVTPIEPTLDAGAHYDSFGGCWYYKIGHRVRVHIGVSGLTANTTTVLWTLPQGYRPYSGIAFTGQSSVYSNYARCRVLENGEVRVNAVSTYAVAYIEFDAFS